MNPSQSQLIKDALMNLTFARNRLADAIDNYTEEDAFANLTEAETLLAGALRIVASVRSSVFLAIPKDETK